MMRIIRIAGALIISFIIPVFVGVSPSGDAGAGGGRSDTEGRPASCNSRRETERA